MKRISFVIVVLFMFFQSKGQETNQLNEMINSSINSYIVWSNDFVKQGISLRDTCQYYVCKDGFPADFPRFFLSIVFFIKQILVITDPITDSLATTVNLICNATSHKLIKQFLP